MAITSDPAERAWTLRERDLDFADAEAVFAGVTIDIPDERRDYGEARIVTVGGLRGRMVIVGWTPRGDDRHAFGMRTANEREQKKFGQRLSQG